MRYRIILRILALAGMLFIFGCSSKDGKTSGELTLEKVRVETLTGSLAAEEASIFSIADGQEGFNAKDLVLAMYKNKVLANGGRLCVELQLNGEEIGIVRPGDYAFDEPLWTLLQSQQRNGSDFQVALHEKMYFNISDTLMFQKDFHSYDWKALSDLSGKDIGEICHVHCEETVGLNSLKEVAAELSRQGVEYILLTTFRVSEKYSLHD